jgi:anti-sigma factor RsiW
MAAEPEELLPERTGSLGRPMRMRQSFAQFEAAFREETVEDRERRERLRREAIRRARVRRAQRQAKHGTLRFVGLVASILATTAIVAIVMFQMLALWFR